MQKTAWAVMAMAGTLCWGQPNSGQARSPGQPGAPTDHATSYYHYALAHMYAEMGAAEGNRDYFNRAIENYKEAIKADPSAPMLSEELSDLYIQTGRLREAQTDAEAALKQNPNDLSAHRLLARIFTRQIGDQQRNRSLNEDMLKGAIEQYQKITEIDPKDVDGWLMLGRLQKVAQNSVDAEKAFQKALAADPDNDDAMTNLALVYAERGDEKAATDLLKKAAEKSPSSESLLRLAGAYEQMRNFNLAADTLRRALDMNPSNAGEIARQLGQDLVFAQRFADAEKVYRSLVEAEPGDAQSYLRLSQIYREMRNFDKAREAADKARSIEPNDIEIRYNDVAILESEGKVLDAIKTMQDILSSTRKNYYNQGERAARITLLDRLAALQRDADQPDAAVDSYRQVAQLDQNLGARTSAEIVETYHNSRQFAKAEQEADAALKKSPDDRTLHVTHALLVAEMGKADAGAAEVKKLMDGKTDREIYLTLAQVYDKGKKWGDMAKALDAAEKLSSTQDEKQNVWFMRGAMFERQKNIAAAEAEFRKVLMADPDHASALNYVGFMLADRNMRLQEALGFIQKAVDKEPYNGAFLDSLGWVYFRMGRLPEAEDYLRRAVERTPHDPSLRDHLGEVLMKVSKTKEAVAQWELSLKEWEASSPAERETAEMNKVREKLDSAKVRLAKEAK
jgi:tetratricopeptide (TPR) repeat protein